MERKSSFAEMVLEKYGPPIVRKTRHMLQADTKKVIKKPVKGEIEKVTKENVGVCNRPQLLVR